MDECSECVEWGCFPCYGVAPHKHVGLTDDHSSIFGSTRIIPKNEWPDNFEEDPDAPGCGTYYCKDQNCSNHIKNKPPGDYYVIETRP